MKGLLVAVVLVVTGCATMRRMQDEENRSTSVTVTANPDTVRSCTRVVSIAPTDYRTSLGGGPTSTADIPHWLRVQAVKYGGNTVLMSGSGVTTIGEIYRCPAP